MAERVTGPCKLCGAVAELIESHIIPRWAYKRAHRVGGANGRVVDVRDGVAMYGGKQYKEHMLCGECEDRLHHWETYVAEVSMQPDGSFPAASQATLIEHMGGWERVDLSALETKQLVRFAVSVVWRAHASSCMPEIRLGPYGAQLGTYLLAAPDALLPECSRLNLSLLARAKQPPVAHVIMPPTAGRQDGCRAYDLQLHGMWFRLFVGNTVPSDIKPPCLDRTQHGAFVDAAPLHKEVVHRMAAAVRKGKLARSFVREVRR
jgi:hypothetical protein